MPPEELTSSGRAPIQGSRRVRADPNRQRATRKYDFCGLEKGEGKMFIGMEGAKRDGVRDQRIAKVVELVPPERLLEELPLGEERSKARGPRPRGSASTCCRGKTRG